VAGADYREPAGFDPVAGDSEVRGLRFFGADSADFGDAGRKEPERPNVKG
jgi:hypothetical protein